MGKETSSVNGRSNKETFPGKGDTGRHDHWGQLLYEFTMVEFISVACSLRSITNPSICVMGHGTH